MTPQQACGHAPESVMLMINAQAICYAFSVTTVKTFQDVLDLVKAIPGTIVTTQIVLAHQHRHPQRHPLQLQLLLMHVTKYCLEQMMAPQQTWRHVLENAMLMINVEMD